MAVEQKQASSEGKKEKPAPRSMAEIQQDMAQTRERLVSNIEQLKAETSPKALQAKAVAKAKATFLNEDGSVRTERVAAVAGTVVALYLVRRGFKARARRRELRALAEVVWVPVPRQAVNAQIAPLARTAKELAPLTADAAPRIAIEQG